MTARHASFPGWRAHCRGMTLIELMVSLVIGLFLTWGAIEVYLQSKGNYRAAEVMTRLQENARFALDVIEPDLRLAGNFGLHRNPDRVDVPGGIVVTCDGADVAGWALTLAEPVAATDDDYDLACAAYSAARANSDVLVVRHASDQRATPQAGRVQIASNLSKAGVFSDGNPPADLGANPETRDLVVDAYYVDEASSFDDDIPSLRRQTLVAGGVIEDQEMVSGVENLQVQYGLDTDGDGSVERYVDPDNPAVAGAQVVAVRLWMLVRSEESPGQAFQDLGPYQPLDEDAEPITPAEPLYPPQFQRLEVTKTIFLRNRAGG